jgi:hypothetical protein
VTISIGPAIAPAGRDPIALTQEVERWIEGEVERLGVPAELADAQAARHQST